MGADPLLPGPRVAELLLCHVGASPPSHRLHPSLGHCCTTAAVVAWPQRAPVAGTRAPGSRSSSCCQSRTGLVLPARRPSAGHERGSARPAAGHAACLPSPRRGGRSPRRARRYRPVFRHPGAVLAWALCRPLRGPGRGSGRSGLSLAEPLSGPSCWAAPPSTGPYGFLTTALSSLLSCPVPSRPVLPSPPSCPPLSLSLLLPCRALRQPPGTGSYCVWPRPGGSLSLSLLEAVLGALEAEGCSR